MSNSHVFSLTTYENISDPGLLLSKYQFVDETLKDRKISCPEKSTKPDMTEGIDTTLKESEQPSIEKSDVVKEENETTSNHAPSNDDYKKWYTVSFCAHLIGFHTWTT